MKMGLLLPQPSTPFASLHAIDSEQNEGNTEQLAHIEEHTLLESYLILLGVLNEDTAGKDKYEAEPEEIACSHTLGLAPVYPPSHEEEARIADGLIELSRMSGSHIHSLKDEGPGNICHPAYYLGVHEVSQAYGTCTYRGDDGHIIQHPHEVNLLMAGIEYEREHQSQCTPMAGQSLISGKGPVSIGIACG